MSRLLWGIFANGAVTFAFALKYGTSARMLLATFDSSQFEDISEDLEVAIIGCYVNGPGESKAADIGLTGASPNNLLYINGLPSKKLSNEQLVDEIESQVRDKINSSSSDTIIARG